MFAVCVGALALFAASAFPSPAARTLDTFENLTPWTAQHTDDVSASLHSVAGKTGKAMRLDFDFAAVNGYATAHRALALDLPPNYEISFWLRGEAPINTFQFKLIDASGENVWWLNKPDFTFPHEWQQIRIKQRQIEFAWGPAKDHSLRHSAALEFVVSSGRDGGHGSVYFDQLSIRELPVDTGVYPRPVASASSSLSAPAQNALEAQSNTAWCSDPAKGNEQTFNIDLRQVREFGGLVLDWQADHAATRYDVQFSEDGANWRTRRSVRDGDGGSDALDLPESETRYLRLLLHAGQGSRYCLKHIAIKDLAWGETPNAFFQGLAKDAPRGSYPRGFSEQSYWTLVGVDGGPMPALISEDGALQPGKASFSIEPFLLHDGRLTSWADVTPQQSLREGYLPIPGVEWKSGQIHLAITAFASGTRERSQVIARYRLENAGDTPQALDLVLTIRPFQVNPPAQFLNTAGGVSAIHDLAWDGQAVRVNGAVAIVPLDMPDRFFASSFDAGKVVQHITSLPPPAGEGARRAEGGRPEEVASDREYRPHPNLPPQAGEGDVALHDDTGYASGALVYHFTLPAHGHSEVALVAPLTGTPRLPAASESASAWVERELAAVASQWRTRLNRVSLTLPPQALRIGDALRTALAHILMSRDGAALRPGTRSYARSWIRDGAMIADALLRLGETDTARAYVDWYAPHQFGNGKVPCCVDHRGSDPVPENDSHGELIHAIAQVYRYAGDRAALATQWPRVEAAIQYMDGLRAGETGDKDPAFKGLMPASISHEGYSAKPMHSYWDDFWALTGYDDALDIAQVLGKTDAATRIAQARDRFRADLLASIALTVKTHAIDFIPGCAELGDFDATSTTIALSPAGLQNVLPQDLLRNTFERYWRDFAARSDGHKAWTDYTPYEWRTVGSFVRLGWRDRAQAAVDFLFVTGARPAAWNQWAEVVGRDPRAIRFIGDMPHAWVASDFIRSALDLFAFEREADGALVLAGGVPESWLAGSGVAIGGLRTRYGILDYTLQQNGKSLVLRLSAGATPPGGFVFAWPGKGAPGITRINGRRVAWQGGELHIAAAPARVVMDFGPSPEDARHATGSH